MNSTRRRRQGAATDHRGTHQQLGTNPGGSSGKNKRRRYLFSLLFGIGRTFFLICCFALVVLNLLSRGQFWEPSALRPSPMRVVPRVIALLDEYGHTIILSHQLTVDDLPMVHGNVNHSDVLHSLPDSSPYKEGDCVPMHPWQTTQYPSCNILHEIITSPKDLWYVNEGSQSIVFEVKTHGLVLKTQGYDLGFEDRYYERRRKDAIVQERLTSSPYVASINGFCAMSVLAPFAPDGDLGDYIDSVRGGGEEASPMDKLRICVQVAEGLAALHGIDDSDGSRPSFAHNDLDVAQHVYYNGIFLLNDFNYGRILLYNPQNNETCKMASKMGKYKFRAPEDLAKINDPKGAEPFLLDKADVYSMGIEFYIILTNMWLWEGEKRHKSGLRIMAGERPPIPDNILESTNEADQAILQALKMCWKQDPEERPTAREVARLLGKELCRLEDEESGVANKERDGIVRVKLPPLVHGPGDYGQNM